MCDNERRRGQHGLDEAKIQCPLSFYEIYSIESTKEDSTNVFASKREVNCLLICIDDVAGQITYGHVLREHRNVIRGVKK